MKGCNKSYSIVYMQNDYMYIMKLLLQIINTINTKLLNIIF